jgi:CheY-like chemotaxis protein
MNFRELWYKILARLSPQAGPEVQEEEVVEPSPVVSSPAPSVTVHEAPKILYIESHSTLRDLLSQQIALKGNYRLVVAQNGREGVEKARSWQPDIILTGLRLPVMDGFKAIKLIRDHPTTAHIPIIVISAWNSASHKERALTAGANEHITPPVEIDRLLQRIQVYLNLRK